MISNLVFETSTTTGTGNFTLSALTAWRSFNAAFGTGGTDVFFYFIRHKSVAEWEVGTGHLSASTTLVRDTVIASSSSNALVNFSAGDKDVVNDIPASLQIALGDDVSFGQVSSQPSSPISNPPYALVVDLAATNLVTNPSIETNTTGWSASGANASISRITSDAFSGSACLRVQVSPAAASQGVVSSSMTVSPSTSYIFSVWLRDPAGSSSCVLSMTGNNSGATSVTVGITSTWKRYWVIKTTNGSDTSATVSVTTSGSSTMDIRLDAACLEAGTAPSMYFDGSLGAGHSWSGTAHASTSSRAGGVHILTPITGNSFGVNAAGEIVAQTLVFRTEKTLAANPTYGVYGLKALGSLSTLGAFGVPGGVVYIENDANGIAAHLKSGVTSDFGALLEFGSLTSGTGIAVAAPSDKTAMIAAGGLYFKFFDKSNKNDLQVGPELLILGSNNQNIKKRLQLYGGGRISSSTTAKTGTVAWSGTAVTGSGTSFTTEYAIGDVMVISGQNAIIRSITSNTAIVTANSASPTVGLGTAHARRDDQYRPPVIFLGDSSSDQLVAGKAGLFYGLWPTNSGHLKIKTPPLTAPAQTLSTTSGSTAFTTSANVSGLAAGDWVFAVGMGPRQVYNYAGTSGNFRRAADATVSTSAFRYRKSDDATYPTSDTDSDSTYVNTRAFRDTSKSIGATASPTSIFNTAPIIPGGAFSTDRVLRIKGCYNVTSGTGNHTLDLQVNGSSVLINTAETVTPTGGHVMFEIVISPDGSATAQQASLMWWMNADANGSNLDTAHVSAALSIDTTKDFSLDILLDSSASIATTVRYITGEWI